MKSGKLTQEYERSLRDMSDEELAIELERQRLGSPQGYAAVTEACRRMENMPYEDFTALLNSGPTCH